MSPQFLSRFDSLVLLDDLDVDSLVRIFLESPQSGYGQSRDFFAAHGLDLVLSPAAVRRIATEAARQPRLGARALQRIFRRVIQSLELDPAAAAVDGAIVIDVAEVEAALQRG
jgi:ATP-dependent Clp protease ATP-binding subunit ClpX